MIARPYTLKDAFHEELPHWRVYGDRSALLMAFTFCLMERMAGRDPSAICGPSRLDVQRAKAARRKNRDAAPLLDDLRDGAGI